MDKVPERDVVGLACAGVERCNVSVPIRRRNILHFGVVLSLAKIEGSNMTESFRDQMLSGQSEVYADLQSIWNQKRGRPPIDTEPQFSLAVCLASPQFAVDDFADNMVSHLANTDPETMYRWSKEWGQARIALAPGQDRFVMVDTQGEDSKRYSPIFTRAKCRPSEMMAAKRELVENAITIVINDDEPVSMEGAVLQVERMVDEAVWTICNGIQETEQVPGAAAYSRAVEYVQKRGLNIAYATANTILDLKSSLPDAPVRLYGDIHKQSTVPPIIGIILYGGLPVGAEIKYPKAQSDKEAIQSDCLENHSIIELADSEDIVANLSITLGKRLHAGHLFMFVKAWSALRGSDRASMCVEFNDTGPQIDAMLEVAASETGKSVEFVAAAISAGYYALKEVESWYGRRNKDPVGMYYVPRAEPLLSMSTQAEEMHRLLQSTFPNIPMRTYTSSTTDYSHVLSHSDYSWRSTGFEVMDGHVLAKRGGTTALLARMGFLDRVARENPESKLVYIDSSPTIATATRLSERIIGYKPEIVKGAALGFDFDIHSGSSPRDDITIAQFLDWYHQEVNDDEEQLALDLEYMMTFMPLACPKDDPEAFYNFANLEGLRRAIAVSHSERLGFLKDIATCAFPVLPNDEGIAFREGAPKAERVAIKKILRSALGQLKNQHPHVYKARDLDFAFIPPGYLHEELTYLASGNLLAGESISIDAPTGVAIDPTLIKLLQAQGYTSIDKLQHAAHLMLARDISFQFQLTPYQLLFKNLVSIVTHVSALGTAYQRAYEFLKRSRLWEVPNHHEV